MDEVDDADLVVERVAALDLGKAGLEACVRVPHPQRPGRRMQELRGYATATAQLLAMAAWLRHWHVQRVVMESTSTYWKGVYYLLDAEGFDCWLVNAREVKNVPGRAKTDRADAVWLAKVAERGMCRPSLVQPPKSADCAISPATAAPWYKTAPASSNGPKSCSSTPRSRSRRRAARPVSPAFPGGASKDHQLGVAEVQSNVLRFAAVIDHREHR
jgi:hypothetical protein